MTNKRVSLFQFAQIISILYQHFSVPEFQLEIIWTRHNIRTDIRPTTRRDAVSMGIMHDT